MAIDYSKSQMVTVEEKAKNEIFIQGTREIHARIGTGLDTLMSPAMWQVMEEAHDENGEAAGDSVAIPPFAHPLAEQYPSAVHDHVWN